MQCIHYEPVAQASDFPRLTMDAESRWGHCGDVEQKTEEGGGGGKKGVTDLQANKLALVCFHPTKCTTKKTLIPLPLTSRQRSSRTLPTSLQMFWILSFFMGQICFLPLFLFQKYTDMNMEKIFPLWNRADKISNGPKTTQFTFPAMRLSFFFQLHD